MLAPLPERAARAPLCAALRAEVQKVRRRHDPAVCLLALGLALAWAAPRPDTPARAASGCSALLFALPIVHAVVMPVAMAVLAARLWDCEARADSLKLLYTVQSRRSLFAAKALLGLAELAALTGLEAAALPLVCRVQGYTDALALPQRLWLLACTLAVNCMLFFAAVLLLVLSRGPVPALCAGVAASLTGLFSAYMPPAASLLVPWGYFVPLSRVGMDWDSASRTATYYTRPADLPLLAVTLALAAGLCAAGWYAVREKEV